MWIKSWMSGIYVYMFVTGFTIDKDNDSGYSIVVASGDKEYGGTVVKKVKSLDEGKKILMDFEEAILNGELMFDLSK